jgi:hypothetical protein
MEYNFWLPGEKMEWELCKTYIDEIHIPDDLRAYLHQMIYIYDSKQ